MGNEQQTRYSVLEMPSAGNWKEGPKTDHCLVIRNQETGQEAEVYRIGMRDGRALDDQLAMYEYRKTNQTQLVSVLNVQKAASSGLCSGTDSYKIVTERIPIRLNQVDNLQLPEAMYVLKECLSGFDLIHNSIDAPINITKEMIGFTPSGKVKVWVNSNFAVNMPDRESYIKGEAYQYDQSIMPLTLYKLVEEQTTGRSFPPEFKIRIENEERNTLKFSRMLQILRNFCIQYNIPPLERLHPYETEQQDRNNLPQQKITLIQETTITKSPPKHLMEHQNSSISMTPGFQNQSNIPMRVDQPSLIKDRALPTHSEIYNQVVHAHETPMRYNNHLNYQVNFPMNSQQMNNIPIEALSFNTNPSQIQLQQRVSQYKQVSIPQMNYQQAITYEQRPSHNIQRPYQSPQINVPPYVSSQPQLYQSMPQQNYQGIAPQGYIGMPSQPQSKTESYQDISYFPLPPSTSVSNGIKQHQFQPIRPPQSPHQFTFSNNYKLPLSQQNEHRYQHNLDHLNEFKFKSRQIESSFVPSYNSSQTASFSSSPLNNPFTRSYENGDQIPPSSYNSPMKNNAYLNNQGYSDSAQSFKFQEPHQYDFKNGYQYSTSAKKEVRRPIYDFPDKTDIKKALFQNQYIPEFKPKPIAKNTDSDLLRRIEQLTNDVMKVNQTSEKGFTPSERRNNTYN